MQKLESSKLMWINDPRGRLEFYKAYGVRRTQQKKKKNPQQEQTHTQKKNLQQEKTHTQKKNKKKKKKKKKNPRQEQTHTPAHTNPNLQEHEFHGDFFFHIRLPQLGTRDLETRFPSLNMSFKASRCQFAKQFCKLYN